MPPANTDTRIGGSRPTRSEIRPTTGLAVASSAAVPSHRVPIATASPTEIFESERQAPSVPKKSREGDEPDSEDDLAVPQRSEQGAEGLRLGLRRPVHRQRPERKCDREQAGGAERDRLADDRGGALQDWAEEGADDRRRHGRADRLPTARGWRLADEPRKPAVQASALPNPWTKRDASRTPDRLAGREDERRDGDDHEPGDRGRASAEARGRNPAREPAQKRARGYAAARTPAPAFERSYLSAYSGRSGVSATKNIVSTNTVPPTSSRSLRTGA